MSLISFSPLQDGVTGVNAAATNTPLSTIYNDYNGNITNANISASANIAFSKISGGSSTTLTAWQSFTPTWTNLSVGNGTLVAKYVQIGKTVHFRIKLIFGSTTSISGNVSVALPVTPNSDYVDTNTGIDVFISILDSGTNLYTGSVITNASGVLQLYTNNAASTNVNFAASNITSSNPMTWTTSDRLMLHGTYEAA